MSLAPEEYDRACIASGHMLRQHRVGHTAVDKRDCLVRNPGPCHCEDFRLSTAQRERKPPVKPAPPDDPGRMFDISTLPDKNGRTGHGLV